MNNKIELKNKLFHEKYDNKELTLEELESLFCEDGFMFFGHGTGRSGNSDEVVNLIFENGLRTKDNSLSFTSIALSAPTPQIIKEYQELGIPIPTMEKLKESLNNWKHLKSKRIIIARLPSDYINWHGDRDDHDSEMFGAFMNEIIQENGDIKYYLDSKYILGCYNAENESFRINSKFEKELTNETKKKLKQGYLKALKKTKNRLERQRMLFFAYIPKKK